MLDFDIKNIPIELLSVEIDVEERLESAKALATKILTGDVDNVDDFRLVLEYRISENKGILLFDPIFKNFTLDQLMVMNELIVQRSVPAEERASEVLATATEEDKDGMFDFMKDVEAKEAENKYMQDAMDFMNNGEFK